MLSISVSLCPAAEIAHDSGKTDDLFFFPSDAISENNPRVIDDSSARKLATDLKRCSYYETCATYGLNVERVFQDGKYRDLHFPRLKNQRLYGTDPRPEFQITRNNSITRTEPLSKNFFFLVM
jgi:hypothetical protein